MTPEQIIARAHLHIRLAYVFGFCSIIVATISYIVIQNWFIIGANIGLLIINGMIMLRSKRIIQKMEALDVYQRRTWS